MGVEGKGSCCLMGAELDCGKRKRVLENGDDGCTNKVKATELYAYKRLKW